MRAVIVTGGNPPSKELLQSYIKSDDFLIGVDHGCDCLLEYDIIPSLILGDFDSVNKEAIEVFKKKNVKILEYNSDKDYTDTDLGYLKAKENGSNEILLFGAIGTRMDHTLGNLGILIKSLKEGVNMQIIDDNNIMSVVDKETSFKGNVGDTISFHALSDKVSNLSIRGAKYKLECYDMMLLEPRAVCNEFTSQDITISFDSGLVLVILSKD